MKYLVVALMFTGCGTLNSSKEANKACTDQLSTCGCGAGMDHCQKNADGTTCCTPAQCGCKATAGR